MTDPAMLPRRCAVPLAVLTLLGVGGAPVLAQESLSVMATRTDGYLGRFFAPAVL